MSIFESLLNELDVTKRRDGVIAAISDTSRKERIAAILHATDTVPYIRPDKEGNITRIEYLHLRGRIILTSTGIDQVDEFGTAWNVAPSETIQSPNN